MLPSFLTNLKYPLNIGDNDHVLLAVSGGVDSMVLLDLFRRSDQKIAVAHCNFQLRGYDSDLDQQLVEKYCQKNNIPFYCKKFDTLTVAESTKESIQMLARRLRFDWFNELIRKYEFHYLATAHHAEDSLETALINLTRGTGINGLKGITPKSGQKIRPLLSFTKEDILIYAKQNSITWREDSSNASTKYHRNKIRHQVLPVLEELNPAVYQTFLESSEQIASSWGFIERQLSHFLKNNVYQNGYFFNKIALSNPDIFFLFQTALAQFTFSKDQISKFSNGNMPETGAKFMTNEWELSCSADGMYLLPIGEEKEFEMVINSSDQIIECPIGSISIVNQKVFPDKKDLIDSRNAYFDVSKLQFPLILRKWRKGDKFTPFGMKGQKLISDYLIDIKMPISLKSQQMVLCSNETIIWLVGERIAANFSVTENADKILYLRLNY